MLLDSPYTTAELSEAMLHLLQNPDEAKLLGENGREKILGNFTVENIAAQWSEFYGQI